MDPRRSSNGKTLNPIAGASFSGKPDILNSETFRRMIALERKRSERSRKPFMLLLLDMGGRLPSETSGRTLAKVLPALTLSTRETDIIGWYAQDFVVGVLFTEIAAEDGTSLPNSIITRVTGTLRNNLNAEQFNLLNISFHLFPEEWDHELPQRPSNPTLYPDLSPKKMIPESSFRVLKRSMDVCRQRAGDHPVLPVVPGIALAVKLTSEGPILFRQRRVGQHGKSFVFLKFRSMYTGNDASKHKEYVQKLIAGKAERHSDGNGNGVFKLTKDPRITRVGAFLRRSSLDELPQLINVLKGQMSLVGPRPPLPYEVEKYDVWHRRRLLEAKPGITGLWQVSGRCRVAFDDMVRLDLKYARTWSPWEDIKILVRTPAAVVFGDGAH